MSALSIETQGVPVARENFQLSDRLSDLSQRFRGMARFALDSWDYSIWDAMSMRRERKALAAKRQEDELPKNVSAINAQSHEGQPGVPECSLHYYKLPFELTRIADAIKNNPNETGNIIADCTERIMEDISDIIMQPGITRVFLNLDQPKTPLHLSQQRLKLPETDIVLSRMLDYKKAAGEWAELTAMAVDIRKEILKALNDELHRRGLSGKIKEIAMLGGYIGAGNVGELFSCFSADRPEEEVVVKIHNANKDGKCLLEDYPKELIEATSGNEVLVTAFRSLYSKVLQGDKRQVRRFDILEKVNGAVSLEEYFASHFINFRGTKRQDTLIIFLKSIFLPVSESVKALHDKGLIHRDLKLGNVLISPRSDEFGDCTVKMNDYDLVCLEGGNTRIWGGSPGYASPEWKDLDKISRRSDIFSLGMILYELFGGKMPNGAEEAGSRALDGDTAIPELESAPFYIQTIVKKCLQKDPVKRPDIDELITDINGAIMELEEYTEEKMVA